ncbi:hypothetical protein D9M68_931420 [compost metagenome]
MARSRSFSTSMALFNSPMRSENSSLSPRVVSWLGVSSTSQSCHSDEPSSARIGEFSDASPDRRAFIDTTSSSLTLSVVAICLIWSGCSEPSSRAAICPFTLRRLKNRRFWAAVVPILTRLHERNTYSWMAARIHHMA